MKKPKLSVVMPVYNSDKYIVDAINSILNQTFRDFELIIINDGSIDNTIELIKNLKDKRIKLINNLNNLGVTKSLNIGLRRAMGEYIARCDGDDLYLPERFKKQVKYLNENQDTILVGGNFEIIDQKGKTIGQSNLPISDSEIKSTIFRRNPISHPASMFRKKIVLEVGGYRNMFNGAEDYDLWLRLRKKGKFYNFPDNLIKRRWHDQVVTKRTPGLNANLKVELKALTVRILALFN